MEENGIPIYEVHRDDIVKTHGAIALIIDGVRYKRCPLHPDNQFFLGECEDCRDEKINIILE